jgi:hypothetical protein
VTVDETPAPRSLRVATEQVALLGRARRGPRDAAVEVPTLPAYDEVYGARDSPLRRAVTAYLDQGGDPVLVVRTGDLTAGLAALTDTDATVIAAAPSLLRGREAEAHAWCVEHRRFLLLDCPDGTLPAGVGDHAAGYTPRLRDAAGRRVWTAAAVAGVVRRVDREQGVWKAPTGEPLTGLVADPLPPGPEANPVRLFPDRGLLVWGAHTGPGEPGLDYVPLRRLLLSLERSLDEGLRWTVYEPQGEPLWTDVRRSVEDFLVSQWRAGAFQGAKPEEAFFVRCDRSTMTQADLDAGRLVCFVGVAPARPAEFVVLEITQVVGRA